MTYELCLEYGTYPITPIEAYADERQAIPDFIKEDYQLLAMLEEMNKLFHELFLTIECQFHYIGSEFPDKIAKIKDLYEQTVDHLNTIYSNQDIVIEHFLLR